MLGRRLFSVAVICCTLLAVLLLSVYIFQAETFAPKSEDNLISPIFRGNDSSVFFADIDSQLVIDDVYSITNVKYIHSVSVYNLDTKHLDFAKVVNGRVDYMTPSAGNYVFFVIVNHQKYNLSKYVSAYTSYPKTDDTENDSIQRGIITL